MENAGNSGTVSRRTDDFFVLSLGEKKQLPGLHRLPLPPRWQLRNVFFVFTFRFIDIENHKCRVSIRKMRRGRNKSRYISAFGIWVVFLKVAAAI